jgi:hypothetical protein
MRDSKGWTVFNRRVSSKISIRAARVSLAFAAIALLVAAPVHAQSPVVSVGAGAISSFQVDSPDEGDTTSRVFLNSVRLYVNGAPTEHIKFMFNTEYLGATNAVGVLDAVAQWTPSEKVNIWFGRFLAPSDRANLYGPYYANHFYVYTDGVQDGYPFISNTGRANGVMYWGQFGILKVSGGIFDGPTLTAKTEPMFAARAQLDFWDPENGYYLNGTYYGDKNLLALGAAVETQDGDTSWNADFLLEKKVGAGGAFTVEAEYAGYDKLGGYNADYAKDQGGYVLASYLFPSMTSGGGHLQLLGKFGQANFSEGRSQIFPDYNQKTTEIDFNYVMKQFNARWMIFYLQKNYSDVFANDKRFGIGLQVQM